MSMKELLDELQAEASKGNEMWNKDNIARARKAVEDEIEARREDFRLYAQRVQKVKDEWHETHDPVCPVCGFDYGGD
jgi:hypothetical protein